MSEHDNAVDAALAAVVQSYGMEDVLNACSRWLRADAAAVRATEGAQGSDTVGGLLDRAADLVDEASMDYYVSTK